MTQHAQTVFLMHWCGAVVLFWLYCNNYVKAKKKARKNGNSQGLKVNNTL